MLKNLATEGTSIGVIINQLREENLWPTGEDEFLRRYTPLFGFKWKISTNAMGDLVFSTGSKPMWSAARKDGRVQRIGIYAPEEADLMPLVTKVDFSKELINLKTPNFDSELYSELKQGWIAQLPPARAYGNKSA